MQTSESGQAIVEYILVLLIAAGIAIVITSTLRRPVFNLWVKLSQEVAAPCPQCPPPEGVR